VDFAPGVTGAINLASALPTLSTNITINGPGASLLTVRRNSGGNYRIFTVASGATVSISGMTIANGDPGVVEDGGGISTVGVLSVSGCVFANNTCGSNGGAIDHPGGGTLSITGCTFASNTATNGFGGAIDNDGGDLVVSNSTFSNNAAKGGGAIDADDGTLRLTRCTFVNNRAVGPADVSDAGGALWVSVPATITNCTFSGNSAVGSGGGIQVGYRGAPTNFTVVLVSVTITANTADSDANDIGIVGGIRRDSGTLRMQNSISAGNINGQFNLGAPDFFNSSLAGSGGFASLGYNLVGKTNDSNWTASTGDKLGSIASPINAMLGPLQDNGGPTWTHALLAGSPAIDQGKSFGVTTDQRGRTRPSDIASIANPSGGDGSDIGAFELIPAPLLIIARSLNNVVLSWSTNDTGFTLESTPVLLSTSNTWTNVPGPFGIVGSQYAVTNDTANSHKFYRLRAQ
jgi:predicted outer membrane repeat protein